MGFLGEASEFFAVPGGVVGNFIGDVLHNASNYVCQLHYNTPGVIFDISPFNRELWKELCKDRPSGLPPPLSALYSGGQCVARYSVTVTWSRLDGSQATHTPATVWGEIKSVEFQRSIPEMQDSRGYAQDLYMTCRGTQFDAPIELGRYLIARPYTYGVKIDSVVVTRADGYPDNCGDIPPPQVQPVILPVEQRTTNISVLSVDQSTVNNVTVVADFPSALVDFGLSVPLRLTVDNRKFYLSVDGWYTGEPSDDSPVDLSPVQDNILHLEGTLNQYFAPVNPSVDASLTLIAPSFGKESDEQQEVPGAHWLIIDLTKTPDKAQYGGDSPTVYFAGWIEFLKEGRAFPRQQINFEQSIFRFPDGADGYAYTFTNGAQGDVSVYVEEAQ